VAVAQGFLTVAADPFGEVYIDGVDAARRRWSNTW